MKRGYDLVVIGGGVVGLWTALHAARSGLSVALLERCDRLGAMASGRNSGVLHSGLYYVPGSLKAKHCVPGRHLSVAFLREQGVPFSICGKYIVPAATREQDIWTQDTPAIDAGHYEELERLRALAQTNGVEEAVIRRRDQPFLRAPWVLHIGCTGIVDLPAYMDALERAVRRSGVAVFLGRTCVAGEAGRVLARSESATAAEEFTAGSIVNAAGLYCDAVADMFGLPGFEVRPNKGSYFQLRFALPVQTLVYPLPSEHSGFLGIHYTPDMRGNAWAGPNTAWAAGKSDMTPEGNREAFFQGLSAILPNAYKADDLLGPSKMGLRARLYENGAACRDFVIREQPAGVCHLLGIESPGLTCAPSLARDALARLGVLKGLV